MLLKVDSIRSYDKVQTYNSKSNNAQYLPVFKAMPIKKSLAHDNDANLGQRLARAMDGLFKSVNGLKPKNYADRAYKLYGNEFEKVAKIVPDAIVQYIVNRDILSGDDSVFLQNIGINNINLRFYFNNSVSPNEKENYLIMDFDRNKVLGGKIQTDNGQYDILPSENPQEFELWKGNKGISYHCMTGKACAFMETFEEPAILSMHSTSKRKIDILKPNIVEFDNPLLSEITNGKTSVIVRKDTNEKKKINMKKLQQRIDDYSSFIKDVERQLFYTDEQNVKSKEGYQGRVYDAVSNCWYTAMVKQQLDPENRGLKSYHVTLTPEEKHIDSILLPDGSKASRSRNNGKIEMLINYDNGIHNLYVDASTDTLMIAPETNEIKLKLFGYTQAIPSKKFNPKNGAVLGKVPVLFD